MDPIKVYKCLCDETRLRILNILREGPLCVCHVQETLQLPQPKVSKQLAYMKRNGLLVSVRQNNWTIYQLSPTKGALLDQNLRCLQDLVFSDRRFQNDLQRLKESKATGACFPEI